MSDDWTKTLRGDDDSGPEDARIIRAIVTTHAEVTERGLGEDRLSAAKADLLARLREDGQSGGRAARRWNLRQTGMLMAASVAVIAVGILTFSGLDTSVEHGPIIVASYAEIDTVRGREDDENRMVVDDPDGYGRMLAGQLMDMEIPFVLLRENGDASDRILKVQVDGHAQATAALQWLRELGIGDAPTSVVVIRLIGEEGL